MTLISALALLVAFQASLPSQDEVRQALADQLAARCGEDEACVARQPAVEVRALSCAATGDDMATCRYETRTGTGAWRPGTNRFRFDLDTSMWAVDEGIEGERG